MFRPSTFRAVAGMLDIAPWKLALAAAAVLSGIVAVTVVAFGVFLVVLPVVLLAGVVAAFLAPKRARGMPTVARSGPKVIEVEYKVLDGGERRR